MTTDDHEWLAVFEEIAAQPYFKPRFTLSILQALDASIDTKQRNIRIDPFEGCDAISDKAVFGLSSPTVVLVRWEKTATGLRSELQVAFGLCKNARCAALLIIMPLVSTETIGIPELTRLSTSTGIATKVIGYPEVLKLIKEHISVVTKYVPHLTPLAVKERLKDLERSSHDYWKQKRTMHLGRVQEAYLQNNLALFLGAGVSIDAGLPTWRQLIDHLMIRVVQRIYSVGLPLTTVKVQSAAKTLSAFRGDNPLISARYIRKALGDEFVVTLRQTLYEIYDPNKPSPLIREVVELCRPNRARKIIGARAVVTYNFDDIVERELDRLFVGHRTVSSDTDQYQDEALNIFHVHGLLRNDSAKEPPGSSIDLTFSEERYHHLYTQPYSWSNLQQLFLLKNATCLLIGFSMSDPNLRRLLDISAGRGLPPRHFAFLKRTLIDEAMASQERIPELSREELLMVLKAHHEIQELAFEELGVNIIWVERHDEIASFLNSLRGDQPLGKHVAGQG